ncbi:hypothetical protein Tco_0481984 [Tanacetum coccineum]
MADDQPMLANNRAIAPTPTSGIVAFDLRDNFTRKGHHLSMIKDRQFDGHVRAGYTKDGVKELKTVSELKGHSEALEDSAG